LFQEAGIGDGPRGHPEDVHERGRPAGAQGKVLGVVVGAGGVKDEGLLFGHDEGSFSGVGDLGPGVAGPLIPAEAVRYRVSPAGAADEAARSADEARLRHGHGKHSGPPHRP
jgi:hypothetical protein